MAGRDANKGESSSSTTDFNITFENNTKIYLTRCLSYAHLNNNNFQSQMKDYFDLFQKR